MMKLNRKVEYALIALKYMSQKKPGQLSSAKEISDRFNMPFDATSRALQVLSQYGVLKSEQGAHGGYLIVKDLDKVSFHSFNEMILGPLGIAKCISREVEKECDLQASCNILSPVRNLNQRVTDFLKTLSVADVLGIAESRTQQEVEHHVN